MDENTRRLFDQVRRQLNTVTDTQTRQLVELWVHGWGDVEAEVTAAVNELVAAAKDGRVTRSMVTRSARANRAARLMTARLEDIATQAHVVITSDVAQVVRAAIDGNEALIRAQLPPAGAPARGVTAALSVSRVDSRAVDWIVARSTEQITAATAPLGKAAAAAVRRELVKGVTLGEHPTRVAAAMVGRVRGAFQGGLTRALTISRTEMLDAHRAAAKASDQANKTVVKAWQWVADLGPRTCPACWGMHGTEHPVDEGGPAGHANCRCARVPVTKSWRELGFDIDEPPSVLPDAQAAFDAMPVSLQRQVLGPARFAAYTQGKLPMSSWATRRDNPGWRASYVPSKAPKGTTGSPAAVSAPRVPPTVTPPARPKDPATITLSTPTSMPDQLRDEAQAAIDLIQKVHSVPSAIAVDLDRMDSFEVATMPGTQGYYRPGQTLIRLYSKGARPRGTFVHEFGHLFDAEVMPRGAATAASHSATAEWDAFLKAVDESDAIKDLFATIAPLDPAYLQYATTPHELWARAYFQWITSRTKDPTLLSQLNAARAAGRLDKGLQWEDDDFNPIAAAIDELMKDYLP